MSDVTNEIGRAVEDGTPADVLSHADRSFDVRNDAPALYPDNVIRPAILTP
jgi:hypothetical protein